ncbi:restriction endonuclease subunit S [Aeromonas caviae]|uniref:restriction endonuclease subunit S n=2 Tax=Aeromonas caviae TaxID=648 RepID=UPI001F1CACC7|nr:restriction endonuclease subunit S [Aeromonas caviae]
MMQTTMKVTLEQVVEIRAGHPFRGSIKEVISGNGYVIQTRDQESDGQVAWDSLVCTEVSGRKEPDWLRDGNVIFSARGSRNLASVITNVVKPTVCSPHFFVMEVLDSNQVLPSFLAWQLNQSTLQKYFHQCAEGSVQVSIRKTELEKASLTIPPLEQQRLVMRLAERASREKQIHQRLIALRQQEIEAVARELLK